MSLPPSVLWSARLYRRLLRLYPARFQREYAAEMELFVTERCLDAYRRERLLGVLALWPSLVGDLLCNAAGERLQAKEGAVRNLAATLSAALAACLVAGLLGYLNLTNDEVQLPLALLLGASFALGFARPRRAWL